ncbi:alpha-2-macroglobulin domain protein [Thermotoga petrophila RKU-1]|uniref:Alpha-2-macroglobulin domain protein n=2 Tax=Thermotoga petrophila TaxID=93929 RepID=A5INK5_THEP1|nr:alpha-2-macroglobulin domain protein [Thermotoga petrophila RKU-1]MDK2893739.1 alpha-2-macroglobulin [Thermotoga sp.]
MRSLFFSFMVFMAAFLFGGYAYFSGDPILRVGEGISFVVSDMENVVLNVWKVEDEETFLKAVLTEENFDFWWQENNPLVYRKTFSSRNEWKEFSVPLKEKGFYFATLTTPLAGTSVITRELDRGLFIVTDLEVIYFSDGSRTMLHVFDIDDGFAEKAEVFLYRDSILVGRLFTDEYGTVEVNDRFDTVYVRYKDSRFIGNVYSPRRFVEDEKLFLITDRPIYKPSDTVYFRGQLFKVDGNVYRAFESTGVTVTVFDTKENEIYRSTFETSALGGFSGDLKLPDTAPVGLYRIKIEHGENTFWENFLVEEYRKPEYRVNIETDRETYISGEVINYRIRVKYFNDQPVEKAEVAYYVHAFPEDENGYLVYRGTGFTNEKGVLEFGVKTQEGFQGVYALEVIVVDVSQRQIEEKKTVKVYADDVLISPQDRFVYTSPGNQVRMTVKVTDLSGNPLEGVLYVLHDDSTSTAVVENGEATFTFVPYEVRDYKLELSFKKAKTHVYVYAYHGARTSNEFVIVAESDTVKPGDRIPVRLLAPGNVKGVLGITSKRIYKTIPVIFTGSTEFLVEIPENILEKNIFFVFTGFDEKGEIYLTKKLDVSLNTNFTDMEIKFDKDQYEPGEIAQITIKSSVDEICISVVDEAIYDLVGTEPPVLEEFLYPSMNYPLVRGNFASGWILYVSRNSIRNKLASLPEEKTFADFKQNAFPSRVNVREYFPDTVLWIPDVKLHDGTARISFKVPDSITSFRATAYGFSKDRFSQGEETIVVSKDFYITPHLPSFLREGDIMRLSATVFNRTGKELFVEIRIELPDNIKLVEGNSSRHFLMEANSSHTETWTVKAISPSEESFVQFFASGGDLSDAISLKVPVRRFAFEREFYRIMFIDGEETVTLPEGPFVFSKIRFLSGITPLIEDSLRELIGFPYGCVEQTMSRFFPAVVAANLGLKVEDLDEIIRKGLFRIYYYQHADGGWGWFVTDKTNNFMTCYVMEGLYFTMKAGYNVAESVLERGIEYLKAHPSAYGSYVLDLYDIEHEPFEPQTPADLVFLSMESKEALTKVLKYVVQDDQKAYLKVTSEDPLISEIQLNSVLLKALVKWKEFPELQKKLVNYLLLKKEGYFWTSTKDTSFAILALLEAMPVYESTSLRVLNSGKEFVLRSGEESQLVPGPLIVSGNGVVEVHVVHPVVPKESVSEGMEIKRKFYKRYELFIEEIRSLVDAFVPLGRGYVPHSIHRVEEEKDDELFILPYELRNETVEYGGITMKVNGNRVEIKGETYSFSRIKTQNGLILIVLGNEALVYDPGKNTVTRYLEVLDGDFVGDRGETDSTMWLQKGTTWKNYRMCLFRKKKSENGQKENVVP